MIIPSDRLSHETLHHLIEEFITREGTDYGLYEMTLEEKVRQINEQLNSGAVLIVFDASTETVNLMTKEQYQQWSLSL